MCYMLLFSGLFLQVILFLIKEYSTNSKLFASWVKPSNIFFLGYFIVNFQVILSAWMGYDTIETYLETTKYSAYIGKVLYCGLIGFTLYLLGYSSTRKVSPHKTIPDKFINLNIFKWAFLSLVAFVLFVINIDLQDFRFSPAPFSPLF